MKKRLCLFFIVGISLAAAAALYAAQAEKTAKPAAAKRAVMRTPSEMKWVDIPDAKGVKQTVTWGNPQKGPHGSFAKFEGGTEIPLHTHTAGGVGALSFQGRWSRDWKVSRRNSDPAPTFSFPAT